MAGELAPAQSQRSPLLEGVDGSQSACRVWKRRAETDSCLGVRSCRSHSSIISRNGAGYRVFPLILQADFGGWSSGLDLRMQGHANPTG